MMLVPRSLGGCARSPSVWREWIEMDNRRFKVVSARSPSVWREWIEMTGKSSPVAKCMWSPSVWREWIEMHPIARLLADAVVSLRVEGVD